MLSDFQQKKLTYFFGLLDINKNGFLQLNDFSELAERLRVKFEYEDGSPEHKVVVDKSVSLFYKLLKDIPNTSSQQIKLEGWLQFFGSGVAGGEDEDRLDEYVELIIGFLFNLFDTDHDGYISPKEYADIFEVYGIETSYSSSAFKALDKNGDKRLSRYELVHAVDTFITSDNPKDSANWIFGSAEMIEGK